MYKDAGKKFVYMDNSIYEPSIQKIKLITTQLIYFNSYVDHHNKLQ